jgi:hypothetical protein
VADQHDLIGALGHRSLKKVPALHNPNHVATLAGAVIGLSSR